MDAPQRPDRSCQSHDLEVVVAQVRGGDDGQRARAGDHGPAGVGHRHHYGASGQAIDGVLIESRDQLLRAQ